MIEPRFAFGFVLTFSDGGEPEEQLLHIGTREECDRVRLLLPAVAYSGDRPGVRAEAVLVEISPEAEAAWRASRPEDKP